MTNSVNYNYVPGQSVYVINTLGPNNQYPYWGYPYAGCGFPFEAPGGFSQNTYPNGFTNTTPAIQSGQVLQTRILFTNAALPATIMYDIRVTGEMGTTPFPEDMVFPATAGTSGTQTVNYGGTLTENTTITVTTSMSDTVYVDGAPIAIVIPTSVPTTISALLSVLNTQYTTKAVFYLTSGNIVAASRATGVLSTIVIQPGSTSLFANLPGFVNYEIAIPGVASGLDQAQAYYATLNL